MKHIPLRNRTNEIVGYALVDDGDFAHLMQWTWRLGSKGYAERGERRGGRYRKFLMHAIVCPGGEVDHRDRNRLNNQRSNLRLVTRSEQAANRGVFLNNRCGLRGVRRQGQKWQARARGRSLGVFATPELAAAAAAAYWEAT